MTQARRPPRSASRSAARPPARAPRRAGASDRRARDQRPAGGEGGGREKPSQRRRSDLLSRIFVAVPAAVLAIVFIDLGGLAFALFMILVGCACLHELFGLLHRWRPVALVGFASLAGMVIAARYDGQREVLEVAVGTLPVLFVAVLARGGHGRATISIAATVLGVFWVGLAFAHVVLLRQLPHGNAIIIDVLVGTFLGDTAAYLGGRLFGRRPLAPDVSPNKTVEGLACGMFIAILSVFLAGLYQDWLTQGDALLLGLAVAVLGPLGDLFESTVKRDADAKDAGSLFGPHGGALDRLDAVMFTVVAGYYIWIAVAH